MTPLNLTDALPGAVSAFGAAVTSRFQPHIEGEPEEKLRQPIEALLEDVAQILEFKLGLAPNLAVTALNVRPDFGVHRDDVLTGHIEVKAPGKGVDPSKFHGHDKAQWQHLQSFPNLILTDGNEWALYRQGVLEKRARLSADVRWTGEALKPLDENLARLFIDFFAWQPIAPDSAAKLTRTIAGLCRLLRQEVLETLIAESKVPAGAPRPFTDLANDWRALLFPQTTDDVFADSYAQTVTFALLLCRSEHIDVGNLATAAQQLGKGHGLLGRALQVLTDQGIASLVSTSLGILQRVIAVVDWDKLKSSQAVPPGFDDPGAAPDTPWLYFYEDFLSVYDPELRNQAGAYYTPPKWFQLRPISSINSWSTVSGKSWVSLMTVSLQ